MAFTEHHLSVEDMTVSNNPAILNMFFGAKTKRLRHGALGYVLPAHNPLRVAEDIAMIDQLTRRCAGGPRSECLGALQA